MEHILRAFEAFIPPPSGWVVVCLIVALALWASWSLWREYERLCLERSEGLAAAKRVVEQASEDELRERLEQWATRSELRDTLTARATRGILAMHQARNPDMEAILTMLDYSEVARLNLARSAPSWLLLLGIGGTVIGLASAIIELAPQIQATVGAIDPRDASKSLAQALEAMRHAFACSLWGIVMAVLVSLANRKVLSEQQQTVASVQEWVISEVASKLLPKSEAVQLTEIQRTLQAGRQFLQEVTEKIHGVTDLMSQAANSFNTVLVDTVQKMEGIGSDLHRSARDIQHTLLQASAAVQESTQGLQESARSLSTSSEEYRDAIQQLTQGIVHRLIDVSTSLKDTQTKYTEAHQQALQAFGETRATIQSAFEGIEGRLTQVLENHRQEMSHVDARLREVVAALRSIAEADGTPASERVSIPEATSGRAAVEPHPMISNSPISSSYSQTPRRSTAFEPDKPRSTAPEYPPYISTQKSPETIDKPSWWSRIWPFKRG
jgi:fumarate reductase subunit D/predicted  nucleic acid-binding Zn-ribbon protein